MNSRRKGKTGELQAAKELARVLRCSARRGQQFSGGAESPDVVCSIPGIHWEAKRTETFSLYPALEQAVGDAGESVPAVIHRRNNKPWVVVVKLDDLPRFVTQLYLHLSSGV